MTQSPKEPGPAGSPKGPVLVGVDGSASSQAALELAAAEAVLRDAPLRVVVVRRPAERRPALGTPPPPARDPHEVLGEAVSRATHHHPRLEVQAVVVGGSAGPVLVAESAGAAVTVIGHHGSGGFLGLAAGAVCVQLVLSGCGPVVVTRGATRLHAGLPVVVGIDAGAPAAAATGFAFAEAALRGVPLRAVYVWGHEPVGGAFAPPTVDVDFADAGGQAARLLAEALAGWGDEYPDVKVERLAPHGLSPPAAMLAESARAGLVVVGPPTAAEGGLVSGTVVATLVHQAGCPVAVVHPTGRVVHPPGRVVHPPGR